MEKKQITERSTKMEKKQIIIAKKDRSPKMEKKQGDNVNIYVHAVDTHVGSKNLRGELYRTVSVLYKIEMNRDKYENPTSLPDPKSPNIELDLPLIKPVYTFRCTKDKFYPSGMSFVNLGSKLYFMGGSLSYKAHLLDLTIYDNDLDDYKDVDDNVPVCNAFEDYLECFPPTVYVFDCITSQLLPDSYIPSMDTGKPVNPITFVVDNQIFVLSSRNGPKGMTHFETFNPISKKWKKLPPPKDDFFSKRKTVCGSAVMGRKLFVTFRSYRDDTDMLEDDMDMRWDDIDMLWYDIDTHSWTRCKSPYLPKIYRDSVFVGNTIYSTVCEPLQHTLKKHIYPVLSFDGFDSPNYIKKVAKSKVVKKHSRICPSDIRNWRIFINGDGYSTRCLFHLGGFLNGTDKNSRCLGLVELFKPYGWGSEYRDEYKSTQTELCFVVFEASEGNTSDGSFNGRTIHACHFSTDLSNNCLLNSACVYSS
ncbi:hypothetical protein POM88_010430 [Heracleum sosnowskyi]|uniref:Uncharacterized protein n=1 Tax=Heracleum sosnowskyi TaxID=360622 RepID=A0AAD8IT44_9APIA|nr:hypothetical protein POM88_010426 [Heracleum sosnowskyi]KAK1391374.1 hypothetical protein POM88_010430 [Heracleum sosnowskyi]